jgi:3-polyprenyl-4-hydroxybenzoate decarboxylase
MRVVLGTTGASGAPYAARLLERPGGAATGYEPTGWGAPYAHGSAKVDAYVLCPCSIALKEERRLVGMPRQTPLSAIHLRDMLTLREAGATILFRASGFCDGAASVGDLVDFVVGPGARPARAREHTHTPLWPVTLSAGMWRRHATPGGDATPRRAANPHGIWWRRHATRHEGVTE